MEGHDAESFREQRKLKGINKEGRDSKKSGKKQVFSFGAAIRDICIWKAFVTASGRTMENIGTAALNEYMRRHRLSGIEQAVFEALCTKAADTWAGI